LELTETLGLGSAVLEQMSIRDRDVEAEAGSGKSG